jgi:sulfite reductase beta subunit-like hemoprotein
VVPAHAGRLRRQHAQRRRRPGKVIGPSFAADEIADAVEAVLDTYRAQRAAGERFIDTVRRIGIEPFKGAGQRRAPHHGTRPEARGPDP